MSAPVSATSPRSISPQAPEAAVPVRRRSRDQAARVVLHVVLVLGLLAMVGPFIWMLLSSFKPETEIRLVPPTWWPHHPTLDNYRELFSKLNFPTYFLNSTIVSTLITLGNLIFCSAAGYALAKLRFPGRRALFGLVLASVMVPGMVTFVPLFVLVSNMGMTNTYAGLVLPFLAWALGAFLMRQFMESIPDELIESGRIDGAGEVRIFVSIVLPLCRPALAALGILSFLTFWNSFLWPLVVATTEDKYTLPVALALFSVGQNQTKFGLLLAGSVVVVLPVLVVFLLLQRHFVRGIATTGLK